MTITQSPRREETPTPATVALTALLPALTLGFFGPATIYFTNLLEFNYLFSWVPQTSLAGDYVPGVLPGTKPGREKAYAGIERGAAG